ncbi:hypothetical protein ACFPAG_14380 [Vogesella sp. GCM10023246]|uniref:Transposase n=1 Tax=Vogesella oryzagri TaxID=3160864 RepID=A0ABV1M9Z6_9NEIS
MIDLTGLGFQRQPLPRHPSDQRLCATLAFLTLAQRRKTLLNHERRITSSGAHT